MMKISAWLLHVLLLTLNKYVFAPPVNDENETLPLTDQQLYDFSSRRFDKTVDVKAGKTIKLLQGTTVEVNIIYTFPKENPTATTDKKLFIMGPAPADGSNGHLIKATYSYKLCSRTEVIYKNINAKLSNDMEIKTGSNFKVSIMKELCSILVNNQQDLDGFVLGNAYGLILKDDFENYEVEIVKNNPNDVHFEIKNENETVSGFKMVKFPYGIYNLNQNLITCVNATLDTFFTHNENVLIAPKNIRSLLPSVTAHKTIFTVFNEHSVAEIVNDTILETNNFYGKSDAEELHAITISLKGSETECGVGTLHRIFYHNIYIKMHKLENMCEDIKGFLDAFENNRNNLETALTQFLDTQDREIAKRSEQLLMKCYMIFDMKKCIDENNRCIKDKPSSEVIKNALEKSFEILKKIFRYKNQFDAEDEQIYDDWKVTYKTLKIYELNTRSLSNYSKNEFNLIKDDDFDQNEEFRNLNNTHIQLTNNLTKYGNDLCDEFVKIFGNKSAGVNHCLLLKKIAKKFIEEGVRAINLDINTTKKICIESNVDLLRRNINVLSAYFIKLKTFNEMDKEDTKTYLGEFFDNKDASIILEETNKMAHIIKDGNNKINSIVETKPTEVKETEDVLVEFEQMKEKLIDTIGNETDLIYDQSVILKFINRLSKVDLYLKNHIHVLKGTSEGSSIDFDVFESTETTEEKDSQKIKHPKIGELKDKKEESKTPEDSKEPEKIGLSKTKISFIVVGSLLIFVVLVIVAIIFFKKYKKNRGQSNNLINLENTLNMYVTNEE